jgi:hypothetical protein
MSIEELNEFNRRFQNSISSQNGNHSNMEKMFSDTLEKAITHYSDIKTIFDNYGDLKDSFKDIVASKKNKVKNKI